MNEDGVVRFYLATDRPYGMFCNLYRCEIEVRGRKYRSVEDAYQSLKPKKREVREWILAAPSPRMLAMAAHHLHPRDIAPDWPLLRFPWMMECLDAKYAQHVECRDLLLSTGNRRIAESAVTDNEVNRRWGEVNGVGQNLLGRMLMKIRARLGGAPCDDVELAGLLAAGAGALETRMAGLRCR